MKPVSIIVLMGVAALAGGLLVRYTDHPVVITTAAGLPPKVVAPPIAANTPLPAAKAPVADPVKAAVAPPEKPSPYARPEAEPIVQVVPPAPRPVERVAGKTPVPAPVQIAKADPPVVAPHREAPVVDAPVPVFTPAPKAVAKPAPAPSPAPAPEPNEVTVKAGTLLPVRIHEALSSDHNGQGEVFTGSLTKALVADGFAIAEPGARVRGIVVDVRAAEGSTRAELTLRVREVATSDGQWVHVSTSPWTVRGIAGNVQLRPETNVTFRMDQAVDVVERR